MSLLNLAGPILAAVVFVPVAVYVYRRITRS